MRLDYEARSELRALPPHTCPTIDRVLKAVDHALAAVDSAKGYVDDERALAHLGGAERLLGDVEGELEAVRKANLDLRTAAERNIEECSNLRAEIQSRDATR